MTTEPDDAAPLGDLLYDAWCVIANARDWLLADDGDEQSQEWVQAAIRFRDAWCKTLPWVAP